MARLMIRRTLISIALGILIAIGINEFTFGFLKSTAGRGPERIELVIPAGTADRIAQGQAVPSIPASMTFVTGDTLVVKNEDVANHQLGPLFIPSGTSASLILNNANNYAYNCSFQPQQVFGLDVQEPVSTGTRLYGILFAGIPLGGLMAIYSILIWPLKPAPKASE